MYGISCVYDSNFGRYSPTIFCTVTYKEIQSAANVRRFDVGLLGDVDVSTSTPGDVEGYNESGGAFASVGGFLAWVTDNTLKPIALLILGLATFILGLAGVFFNWVVIKTVFQFGTYFGTSAGMLTAWGVMRDVANIGLLFGFILMGVLLILNVDGGGHGHGGGISARRAIPRLIIFAVLLNFSLFATQFVIDVSNAFASQFTVLAGAACDEGAQAASCANMGISGKVMQMAGIGSIWSDGVLQGLNTDSIILIALSIFVIITALVLVAAGIMLVARVVILSLLMVTSPIGFAGMVIPGLGGLAHRWWSMLISQSFFAPVLLLLIFISLKLSETLNPNGAPLVDAFRGNTAAVGIAGNMQVLVVFAVVIGFMIASLVAASKMGAVGAKFATNSASALVFGGLTRGTNFATGGAARLARLGVQRSGFGNTAAGRALVNRGLRPLEKANLDLRRIPGASAGLGAAGISAGAKAADHATYGDIVHQYQDIRSGKGSKKLTEEYENERNLEAIDRLHGQQPTQQLQDVIKKLGTNDLKKLHDVAGIAGYLRSDQFDSFMKDKDIAEDIKAKVKTARVTDLEGKVATMTADAFDSAMKVSHFSAADKDRLKNARFSQYASNGAPNWQPPGTIVSLSKKDLEAIPSTTLTDSRFLAALSDKQRDDVIASSARTAAEKDAVRGSYAYAQINQTFAAAPTPAALTAAIAQIPNLKPEQAAKLNVQILSNPQATPSLTPAILSKLQDEGLSNAERQQIGNNIRTYIAANPNPPPGSAAARLAQFMNGSAGVMW